MRAAGNQSAGLFFVQVLGQAAADFRYRTANVSAADHDREVAHVGAVLLLEMIVEPIFRDATGGEGGPSPMGLSIHDAEQLFTKSFPIHRNSLHKARYFEH